MVSRHNSITSILETIINKVETELEEDKKSKQTVKRKLNNSPTGTKRSKLISNDIEELYCRICYDSNSHSPILRPCKCKGTMGAVHLTCLEHWLEESNRNSCELCGYQYRVQRTPRYKAWQSILIWFCLSQQQHQLYVRSCRGDLLRCIIITPMTFVCSYICVVAADFYAASNFKNFPPARWTTYSFLAMIILLMFSYFVWMYTTIKYHQRIWFYWWQKTSIVKIIFSSTDRKNMTSKF